MVDKVIELDEYCHDLRGLRFGTLFQQAGKLMDHFLDNHKRKGKEGTELELLSSIPLDTIVNYYNERVVRMKSPHLFERITVISHDTLEDGGFKTIFGDIRT